MRKSDKIEDVILDAALWGVTIWGGIALIAHIARQANKGTYGIGKAERIKRRIYKEVSLAQDAGVDFSKKYAELSQSETSALEHIGKDVVQWKQSKRSIESGKPYVESYYNSLRRAWNAVSGVQGIGRAYNVKDANGNVCLTWIEDAAAHVDAERRTLEAEERAAAARKRLAKTRSSQATAPAKSKQQQILDKFPYLKTHDLEGGPEVTDKFNYVIWKEVRNTNTGDVVMQGPAMAFISEREAKETKDAMRKFRPSVNTYDDGHVRETYKNTLFVKPVTQVNLDNIAGIGALRTEELLEPELMNYLRDNLDEDSVSSAIYYIDRRREPLYIVDSDLNDQIHELVEDWCLVNAIDSETIWSVVDEDDILFAL